MTVYVLDTAVLVDHLRGDAVATEWLLGLDDVLLCREVSRAEVLVGLGSQGRRGVERLFETLQWVGVDEAVARRAGLRR